jgi:hypothetical protein
MPVLEEMECPACRRTTFHEYIPGCTFEDSFWKCRSCMERNKNVCPTEYAKKENKLYKMRSSWYDNSKK